MLNYKKNKDNSEQSFTIVNIKSACTFFNFGKNAENQHQSIAIDKIIYGSYNNLVFSGYVTTKTIKKQFTDSDLFSADPDLTKCTNKLPLANISFKIRIMT